MIALSWIIVIDLNSVERFGLLLSLFIRITIVCYVLLLVFAVLSFGVEMILLIDDTSIA